MKKELYIGNSKIEIEFEKDENEIKKNLKNFYDIVNRIADKCEARGEDTSSWFLTPEQIEEMKKNPKYKFI